jgi:hypothetical protein
MNLRESASPEPGAPDLFCRPPPAGTVPGREEEHVDHRDLLPDLVGAPVEADAGTTRGGVREQHAGDGPSFQRVPSIAT